MRGNVGAVTLPVSVIWNQSNCERSNTGVALKATVDGALSVARLKSSISTSPASTKGVTIPVPES